MQLRYRQPLVLQLAACLVGSCYMQKKLAYRHGALPTCPACCNLSLFHARKVGSFLTVLPLFPACSKAILFHTRKVGRRIGQMGVGLPATLAWSGEARTEMRGKACTAPPWAPPRPVSRGQPRCPRPPCPSVGGLGVVHAQRCCTSAASRRARTRRARVFARLRRSPRRSNCGGFLGKRQIMETPGGVVC